MKSANKNGQRTKTLPIKVSNPDKVFWPEEGYTKLDLIEYYEMVFPFLAPYVKDRMLSLERCPDGMLGECFYQKEMPKGMPPGTPGERIKRSDGSGKITNYVVGGSLATQLALVNLGSIAVHIMGSRASSPRQPDWVCFDLDPQSEKFSDAVRVAPDADEVLSFAQEFVARVAAAHSKELTVEHSIAARGDKVYLDPFRNGFGQTVVAPYSVRRRPKAPVSTPIDWSELKATLDPTSFNIRTFAKRLKVKDPWKEFFKSRQSLKDAF